MHILNKQKPNFHPSACVNVHLYNCTEGSERVQEENSTYSRDMQLELLPFPICRQKSIHFGQTLDFVIIIYWSENHYMLALVTANCKVLPQDFLGRTQENHENLQAGLPREQGQNSNIQSRVLITQQGVNTQSQHIADMTASTYTSGLFHAANNKNIISLRVPCCFECCQPLTSVCVMFYTSNHCNKCSSNELKKKINIIQTYEPYDHKKIQKGVSIKCGKLPNIISSSPHIGSHLNYFTQSNLLYLQHYVIQPSTNTQALSLAGFSKMGA